MCTCTREKKRKLGVVLLPEHQPVALDKAFPSACVVARAVNEGDTPEATCR